MITFWIDFGEADQSNSLQFRVKPNERDKPLWHPPRLVTGDGVTIAGERLTGETLRVNRQNNRLHSAIPMSIESSYNQYNAIESDESGCDSQPLR